MSVGQNLPPPSSPQFCMISGVSLSLSPWCMVRTCSWQTCLSSESSDKHAGANGRAESARNPFRAPRRFKIHSLSHWMLVQPHVPPQVAMALLSKGSACQPAPNASVACNRVRKWQLSLGNLALHEQMPVSSHLHFVMGWWWSSNNTHSKLLRLSGGALRVSPSISKSLPWHGPKMAQAHQEWLYIFTLLVSSIDGLCSMDVA